MKIENIVELEDKWLGDYCRYSEEIERGKRERKPSREPIKLRDTGERCGERPIGMKSPLHCYTRGT